MIRRRSLPAAPRRDEAEAGEDAAARPAPPQRVLQLQRSAGNAAVVRMLARQVTAPPKAPPAGGGPGYLWLGEIDKTYSAALRRHPHKDPDDPHTGTLADLPKGTPVRVLGEEHGWLHVDVELDGKTLNGYVSHELVKFLRPSSLTFDPSEEDVVTGTVMTVTQAFLTLKRAERELVVDPTYKPAEDEQNRIKLATEKLESTKRYTVDPRTYRVAFDRSSGAKIKIDSIEDFVLFVETVERQYPSARPSEIASEIRQLWFADANWKVLVSSSGIHTSGGDDIDIETEPNPIAQMFDMKDLAPKGAGKQIKTRLGTVDISHVLAGIDASLSGSPSSAAAVGVTDDKGELKWETLHNLNKGDPRDFTTWSGDIGQAYGEYIGARYGDEDSSAKLKKFVDDKAPPDQLLADIHGYIAKQVWTDTPTSRDPAGIDLKVSNIVRTLYMVDKTGTKAEDSYQGYLEKVSGKSGADLRAFIVERSIAFAKPWYAKDHHSAGWTKRGKLEKAFDAFDEHHKENEKSAAKEDKLDGVIDSLMEMLKGKVK